MKEIKLFEKEAEDSWRSKGLGYKVCADERSYKTGFQDGYNKANEWHFVKDGDLPKTEFSRVDVTVAYINAYQNPCKTDCCFDGNNFIYWDDRNPVGWKKVDIFGKIYAWKYPEKLPELPKDGE